MSLTFIFFLCRAEYKQRIWRFHRFWFNFTKFTNTICQQHKRDKNKVRSYKMLAYTVVMFAMLCAVAHTVHCLEGILFFFFQIVLFLDVCRSQKLFYFQQISRFLLKHFCYFFLLKYFDASLKHLLYANDCLSSTFFMHLQSNSLTNTRLNVSLGRFFTFNEAKRTEYWF